MSLVDEAIGAGKVPENRREYYERLFARDPEGTTRLIAALQATPELLSRDVAPRGPIRSDAGRRVVAAKLGGYVFEEPLR